MRKFLYPLTNLALAAVLAASLTMSKTRAEQSLQPAVLGSETSPATAAPATEVQAVKPVKIKQIADASVKAEAFLVYDPESNTILAERNSHRQYAVASLTKLLTALVAYKSTDVDEIVTVPGKVTNISPVLGLRPADQVKVQDLISSALIGSANDAAEVLAAYISAKTGQPFNKLMNETAIDLAMWYSHFSNPLGFDQGENYSTAADLRKLVDAVQQYQIFQSMGRADSYSFKSLRGYRYAVRATNVLVDRDAEISAIKTGFTEEASGAMITKITHQGRTFVIIILRSPNREQDTLTLKKVILNSYIWK